MRYKETLNKMLNQTACINRRLEYLKIHKVGIEHDTHMLVGAVRQSEALAVEFRKLLIHYSFKDEPTPWEVISAAAGFDVYRENEEIVVELPPLPLRNGPARSFKYIVGPIMLGLEQFVRETGHKPLEHSIVKFIHVRPEDTPTRNLRDYDNMEVKHILDAISLHLLVDDNMRRCQVLHMSAYGDDAWTQIRICPVDGGDKTILKRHENDVEKT